MNFIYGCYLRKFKFLYDIIFVFKKKIYKFEYNWNILRYYIQNIVYKYSKKIEEKKIFV